MTPAILDAAKKWLKKFADKDKPPEKPRVGLYQGEQIFIYHETIHFAIVSRRDDGSGLFGINPTELK